MIKVGVADYGLNVWYGGLYDYRDRLEMIKSLGYDGLERLEAKNQAEAMEIAAEARKMGLDFATCRSVSAMQNIRFSAALGKSYVWVEAALDDFDVFCRHASCQTKAAAEYGLKTALHNHLGIVETQEQVERFLQNCPDTCLLLDAGHMAAAGGDPIYFIEHYFDRLAAVHVKDYQYKDKNAQNWWERIRFCELGAGQMGDLNRRILELLVQKGYDGWIFVEHDTHLQDPAVDLKISREYIKNCGI